MLLVLLGAGVLASAGSAHHRPGAAPATPAAADALAGAHSPPAHEHRYGTDWVPAPGKRLRPAAGITVVRAVPVGPARASGPLRAAFRLPAPAAPIDDLISRGVLRV
jgi:hypothetical protein